MQDAPIENQNHRHKTDKIIARTLIFSKNQKLQAEILQENLTKEPKQNLPKLLLKKIKSILKTWFNQTRTFANETEPI